MNLHFRRATSVFLQTMPFVLLRMGIGVLLGLFVVAYFGILLWFGTSLLEEGTISIYIAGIGLIISIWLFVKFWRLFSKYVLYLFKAGHIAVIAHILDTGSVPDNQIRFGTGQVKEYFAQATALFAVDQIVTVVVKQFNRRVTSVSNVLAVVPSLQTMVKVLGKAIGIAASYIDEAIIAFLFIDDEPNKWRSARDGLVLYGKTWKPVLLSTVVIVMGTYAAAFVFLLSLTPVARVLTDLSTTYELFGWIVVAGVFLTGYTGVLKPWVKTVVITTFLLEARNETPDSETMNRIANRSERFRELMERADEESASDDVPNSDTDSTPASAVGRANRDGTDTGLTD